MTALGLFKKYPGLTTLMTCELLLFLLVTYQVKVDRHLSLLEKMVLTLVGPLQEINAKATGALSGFFEDRRSVSELELENKNLERRLTDIEKLKSSYVEAELENERLRALLELPKQADWRHVYAEVIGQTHRRNDFMITINKGSKDGLRADQGVLGPNGVVGMVWQVSAHYSKVMTINNHSAAVAALMQTSRFQESFVRGQGNHLGLLENFPDFEPVQVGDLVLTSGLDLVFPKGVTLGRVAGTLNSSDNSRQISVSFSTDFSRLETVTVVIPKCEVPLATE